MTAAEARKLAEEWATTTVQELYNCIKARIYNRASNGGFYIEYELSEDEEYAVDGVVEMLKSEGYSVATKVWDEGESLEVEW